MITVTREFADRVADVAQLLDGDEIPDEALHRLTALAAELVPGGTAAAVTIAMASGALIFAASDQRLEEPHRLQLDGAGPVVETLRHNEPRRVDDTTAECRWPAFCRAAAEAGFASCLVLPLRTDRQPAGAVALYGPEPNVFRGAAHDIAMLVAAQGGAAVHNAALYRTCRRMVESLHTGARIQGRDRAGQGRSARRARGFTRGGLPPAQPLLPEHQPAGQEDLCRARPGTDSRRRVPPASRSRAGITGIGDGFLAAASLPARTKGNEATTRSNRCLCGIEEDPVSVYRVIDVIGTSTQSWEDAAVTAVSTARKSLRDLRVAEVVQQDLHIEDSGEIIFRTKLRLSFKYEDPA